MRKPLQISLRFRRWLLLASSAALTQNPAAWASDASFHTKVLETYNFAPHDLDDAGIEAKSAILDVFWSQTKSLGEPGLQALRDELARKDAPVFFRYDGAKLLLSLSQAMSDKRLALAAIERADLRDVERWDYFYTVHSLSVEGFDTVSAALKILDDPDFKVFVPKHVLTLGQDYALVYLLLPLGEAVYVDRVVQLLDRARTPKEQQSLLTVLAYAVAPRADSSLRDFAGDDSRPNDIRAFAQTLIQAWSIPAQPSAKPPSRGAPALRRERQSVMSHVSDEALIELDRLTMKLRQDSQH